MDVKEPNLLESAINRPKQSVFGDAAYPSIYEKAAALFESIAKKHAFYNANKRTALASLLILTSTPNSSNASLFAPSFGVSPFTIPPPGKT